MTNISDITRNVIKDKTMNAPRGAIWNATDAATEPEFWNEIWNTTEAEFWNATEAVTRNALNFEMNKL
jgi:hypothetical protein